MSTPSSYRNVTISGLPGCGSTTLLHLLRERLAADGWQGFSGGEFMRKYAQEKGLFKAEAGLHHSATHYEDEFDRQVDMGMREKVSSEANWIIEAWLSGFMAQQVPGVLKVLMTCSDDAVRIDRIVNRDEVNVELAKKHINERYQANLAKWSRLYADEWRRWVVEPGTVSADQPINFWQPELYDLVIDTYAFNQQEGLAMVLEKLGVNK